MTDARFDALVRRLEPLSRTSPRLYRARVLLLALLGYAYIGLVLAILLGMVAGSVWLAYTIESGRAGLGKIAIALLVLVGIVAKSLWVTFDAPGGRRLRRDEAPALFEEAEALRKAVRAPKADVVLLTDDYNAAVAQIPRLGIFGFPRNHLIVGLPLLAALPAEQVRAVLAHEFAHLSHAHGKFMAWVYRVRETWYKLMTHFDENPSWFAGVFRWFFDWYSPYFGAYSFVLKRQHEYEADRLAAGVVGAHTMAQTLVDLNVRDRFLSDRFWTSVWKGVAERESPPDDVYARLAAATREPLAPADAAAWVTDAFKRRTDTADTHPALRDRVAAIVGARDGAAPGTLADGTALAATMAFPVVAAEHYLGRSWRAIAAEAGKAWKLEASAAWVQRREMLAEAHASVAALTAKAAVEPLDVEERWQLADWTEDLGDTDASMRMLEELHRDEPGHDMTTFALGRMRLTRGDERGIELLERVMAKDEDAVLPGCRMICDFLVAEGRLEEADRWRERGMARATLLQEADRERSQITATDTYAPSTLPADAVAAIVAQLDRCPLAGRAFVARKVVRHFEEHPVHVLVVTARHRWYWSDAKKELAQAEEIARQLELPDGVVAFALGPDQGHLLKPILAVEGARIYDAKRRRQERGGAVLQPA